MNAALPSLTQLRDAVQQPFRISDGAGNAVEAVLWSAEAGVAMDAHHTCYSAIFVLPPGIQAAQDTYRVQHPQGCSWDLFLVPVRPLSDGRHCLQAVFHYRLPAAAGGTGI